MADIKTREVIKGTVKVLDKAAVAAERTKNVTIRTKNEAEHGRYSEASPETYASDQISSGTETTAREAAHQLKKQGEKGIRSLKDGISGAEEKFQRERMTEPLKKSARKQAGAAVKESADTATRLTRSGQKTVKALKKEQKAVEQSVKTTRKITLNSAKNTIKASQRSVKTAERTAKATIQAVEQSAKAAKRTEKASARAAKAARAAAEAASKAAKATVKATVAVVKAIIAATKTLIAAIAAGGWVAVVVIVIICLIGLIVGSCFGIFFSMESSGGEQTMQEVVREINDNYLGQIDTIKTNIYYDVLEMSGSRAVWPEVLAVYAVKTTTDTENPQEVATINDSKKAILKDIFWQMNVISSRTETRDDTVMVETDDGSGNIVETPTVVTQTHLYITVSHKTAEEMADYFGFNADQREQLSELLAEENRSMWSAVLYGISSGDGEIVAVALSQVGNVGGEPYWSWYGFGSRVDWCACFVSWCANECGYLESGVLPKFSGCETGVQWFKERDLWQDNSYEPLPGDLIFFDWDNGGGQNGLANHVGIVERVEDGFVYTVEGNSGDSCRENHYILGYYEILGYGQLCP